MKRNLIHITIITKNIKNCHALLIMKLIVLPKDYKNTIKELTQS